VSDVYVSLREKSRQTREGAEFKVGSLSIQPIGDGKIHSRFGEDESGR